MIFQNYTNMNMQQLMNYRTQLQSKIQNLYLGENIDEAMLSRLLSESKTVNDLIVAYRIANNIRVNSGKVR
ncbi:MAG: hypothetical protein LBJ18_00320 [Rickettsiales bacterium]|jgi:hypothetical protein|nr:hypothetical protein [Rickettsiales bacterium]